jgi:hypothetical protein
MKPIPSAYRRYRERHIMAGLCVQCSRKPATGLLHCQVCLEKMREGRMARHPQLCPECGKLIKPEERHGGKRFHKLCAQRRRARMYPQQHRLAVLSYQETHRKLGLCYSCPRKAFKGGLCRKHYGMVLERYYERTAGSVKRVN